ncbi:MAG TPA: HAD family hydrolase [Polyangiaceae bacterium]|jgi:phosphoglycolate phosphatase-like HAD superfamily hydrolase|nr:HAD family hydrolase [Polyangiaceae bacterium]
MYLVLFDIDGTLLRSQGLGSGAMERAGRRLFGPTFSLEGIDFGGALDPWIFGQAASRMGLAEPHVHHDAFHEAYLVELALSLERKERLPSIIPGVETALLGLATRTHMTLGLVTGNYTRAAPLKLRAAGLDPARFVVGAFGDDGPTRPDLVRIAMQKWGALGTTPDCRRVVVIGDTPRDVDCAQKNGCRSIAVATGWHDFDELSRTGADEVVRDLSDLVALLERMWAT